TLSLSHSNSIPLSLANPMESITEHIKCAICLDSFDSSIHQPRCFPCGHSFGLSCIHGLKKASTKKCPTCKTDINLSVDPPVNFQLMGLLEACKAASSNPLYSQPPIESSSKTCLKCRRAHPSLRTCTTCEGNPVLCPHCARLHHNSHSFVASASSHQDKLDAIRALKQLEMSMNELHDDTNGLFTRCIDSLKKLQKECESRSLLRTLETMAETNPKEATKAADNASAVLRTTKDNIEQVLNPLLPMLEGISFDLAGANQGKEEKEREASDYLLALSLAAEQQETQDLISFD
ncbi:hypothetical protein PMAYCL1PPCAC_32237, partial [Pristionchus mayeri]